MDIEKIKYIAKNFLDLPVEETKFSPLVVLHPFFGSGILCDKKGMFNYLEEKERFEQYKKELYYEKIVPCDDARKLLFLIRKSYRLTFLKFLLDYDAISLEECGNLLSETWNFIESINNDINVKKSEVLRWIQHADAEKLMDPEDQEVYNSLPDTVEVYRGIQRRGEEKGISWTVDKEKAKFFATRFKGDGIICKGSIRKKYIVAYTNRCDEKEVILDYKKLENVEFENIIASIQEG